MSASPTKTSPKRAALSPKASIRQARIDAASAQAAVEARSHELMADLLRSPPDARLAALDDPALVASDRATLRQSLQSGLRKPRLTGAFSRLARRVRGIRLMRRLRGPAVGLAILGALVGFAWMRSAERATLRNRMVVTLVHPDGRREAAALSAGLHLQVRRIDGAQAEARQWMPGQGYLTAVIPLAVLQFAR
ncbi:hypothetical protein HCU64_19570 [Methylobacterium sp. C25]|uniref:hypothetical protein n=1 Tax=Methylobacterium sp. C25 TaxID=2721622 RepID=UPI001F312D36|nr:hypothetical protein [Methylobacterium sp. C25]MCE4225954.1 hypothetical protein [Methylobacterium sp. C25]